MTSTDSGTSLQSWLASDPAAALREIEAERCRRSLAEFVRQAWHVLEPSTALDWNWHLEAMCLHIQAPLEAWMVAQRVAGHPLPYQNLLCNVPPGCGKSRVFGVMTPAWMWTRWPSWRAIFLSSNPRVALRDSVYCRELVEGDWYRATFRPEWTLSGDQNAKGLFRNTAGGYRQAMGITARITGDRADAIVVDDPHDAEEVLSETSRREVNDRWDYSIANRLNDLRTSLRFGVMQRLHEDDWSGHVLAQGGWEHLCIPQEYEPERARTTAIGWRDPRTGDGELMFPARFPDEVLAREKRRLTAYGYAGQHQQRPVPREGAMFQAQWFAIVDAHPAKLTLARYWDKAGAMPGKGDWTVGVLMGRCDDGYYWVLDVVRGQWPADERNRVIVATAESDRSIYGRAKVYVEQPPGLAKEATDAVVRALAGFDAEGDPVSKDKVERAEPFAAQCRAGNVRMLRGKWNRAYLDVITTFPFGAHDDDVDASSGAFNKLAGRSGKAARPRSGAVSTATTGYRAI
jgi:predicted phage terminase large subunit-like protein